MNIADLPVNYQNRHDEHNGEGKLKHHQAFARPNFAYWIIEPAFQYGNRIEARQIQRRVAARDNPRQQRNRQKRQNKVGIYVEQKMLLGNVIEGRKQQRIKGVYNEVKLNAREYSLGNLAINSSTL